jgi:hypothetical protein
MNTTCFAIKVLISKALFSDFEILKVCGGPDEKNERTG